MIKKIVDKVLNLPSRYIAISSIVVVLALLFISQGADLVQVAGVVGVIIYIGLYIIFRGELIKKSIAIFIIFYLVSFYTQFAVYARGYVIQPFLLSFSSITLFLGMTYGKHFNKRSRTLWVTLFAILLILLKIILLSFEFSYLFTEIMGVNFTAITITLWLYWIANSKKTKIHEPDVISVEEVAGYRVIRVQSGLDFEKAEWIDGRNADPYIYDEVIKADKDGFVLAIVLNKGKSRHYDEGEVLYKRKNLKYLYLETEAEEIDKVLPLAGLC